MAKMVQSPRENSEKVAEFFVSGGVVAQSLYDLRPANVSFKHWFELKPCVKPVYQRMRRMSPKHKIVRHETDKMLKAGVITLASSSWSFPVLIATKKDRKPRFFVDNRILNNLMKWDRFQLPLRLKIFDVLSGAVSYTLLDFFTFYCQIRIHKVCKKVKTFVCRHGTVQFDLVPFGRMNGPESFQRCMGKVL